MWIPACNSTFVYVIFESFKNQQNVNKILVIIEPPGGPFSFFRCKKFELHKVYFWMDTIKRKSKLVFDIESQIAEAEALFKNIHVYIK